MRASTADSRRSFSRCDAGCAHGSRLRSASGSPRRVAAPPVASRRLCGWLVRGLPDELLEAVHVQLARREDQLVPALTGRQAALSEHLAQLRDVDLHTLKARSGAAPFQIFSIRRSVDTVGLEPARAGRGRLAASPRPEGSSDRRPRPRAGRESETPSRPLLGCGRSTARSVRRSGFSTV